MWIALLLAGTFSRPDAQDTPPRPVVELHVSDEWAPVAFRVVRAEEMPESDPSGYKRTFPQVRKENTLHLGKDGDLPSVLEGPAYLWTQPAEIRLIVEGGELKAVLARSAESSCMGGLSSFDVTGEVVLQERRSSTDGPLRIAFRLDCVEQTEDGWTQPRRVTGHYSLDVGEWIALPTTPPMSPRLTQALWLWKPGHVRARGRIDDKGRQGLWESFSPGGILRTSIEYRDGEADGSWRAFDSNGRLATSGTLQHGVPVGEWTDYRYVDDALTLERYSYVNGLPVYR